MQSFPSLRLVAISRLKRPICPTICPFLEEKKLNSYIFQEYYHNVKCKQLRRAAVFIFKDNKHYNIIHVAAGFDVIPPEVWKTRQFDVILLRRCNAIYNQNPIGLWTKGSILPFPKKGDFGLAKDYQSINPYIHSGQDIQCYATA